MATTAAVLTALIDDVSLRDVEAEGRISLCSWGPTVGTISDDFCRAAHCGRCRRGGPGGDRADVVAGLWTVHARVEEIDADTCLLHITAETPRMVAFLLTVLDAEFMLESPPELAAELRQLAQRYQRAAPARS